MNLHITFPLYKLEWPEAQEVKWCPAKLPDGWLSILTLSSVSLSGDEGFSLPALSHLDLRTERREQVVNRGLTPPAHPGLSVFSSSCWLRTGEGKVWICSHICEPAASDRWEWDVVTDASMWRCIFSLCQNGKKANCQAYIKLKNMNFKNLSGHKQTLGWKMVPCTASVCHRVPDFECLSAETPNSEGDRLPLDSYLLVLVSV